MITNAIKIKIKSYDHNLLDTSVQKLVKIVANTGAKVVGPIPMPTKKEVVTIIRSPHRHKSSREQFETRIHKRLIQIMNFTPQTIEQLQHADLPSSVDVQIKI